MSYDKISIKVCWAELTNATLTFVIHNNIKQAGPPKDGIGEVLIEYEAPVSPIHFAACGLLFLEKKLTKLEAWMSVNGADAVKIASSESSNNFWKGYGAL